MLDIAHAISVAFDMIARRDAELMSIIALSLKVSLAATLFATAVGAPLGVLLAMARFRGRIVFIVVANAMLGLPPVVVGLVVYLILSRSGPLGSLNWLFSPPAMVVAQIVLTFPIVLALVHRLTESLWHDYGDQLRVDGASRGKTVYELLRIGRAGLLTAFLFAFGRAIAEVGAIIVVGGNIRGVTRTMTTSIALETSKGELSLALGLGIVLVSISLAVSVTSFWLQSLTGRDR